MYRLLDGPSEKWLTGAVRNSPSLTLYIEAEHKIRHLPWELLYAENFLCASEHRRFTTLRLVSKEKTTLTRDNRPLRVLFMACSPEDLEVVLDFEEEEGMILRTCNNWSS